MTSTLSADRPQTDPSQDLFGYAPFAQTLTKALCNYRTSDSLVLGLYGDWGSGKSTILKFICHNLKEVPEDERPIVIEFNPWWFSGQENLARAFLGQLQAVLPQKHENFKTLAVLLENFAEGIGIAIDAAGGTGLGKRVGTFIKKFFNRPPKDIPVIKKEICDILLQTGKHIIIMVDDIDRLEAEEIRQLFTVIKALADFPNVIYLLAFDQTVVVQAIEKYSGMPGQAYLEKIVQVPFTIPQIDRATLLNSLETRLREILKDTPKDLFEHSRWDSLFHGGIDTLFNVPRDVVRFCNTLSVTYPMVCGEVNVADFVAVEAIRIFIPNLYRYMCENKDEFVSVSSDKKILNKKIEDIMNKVIHERGNNIEKVLNVLFPQLCGKSVFSYYARRHLHISIPEVFDNYFQFSPSSNIIGNTEMNHWLEKLGNSAAFASVLLQAKEQGRKYVCKFLIRLQDYTRLDIQYENIPVVINVLLDIGDELLESSDNSPSIPDQYIINIIIINIEILINRIPMNSRIIILEHSVKVGNALAVQGFLIDKFEKIIANSNEIVITEDNLSKLKKVWLVKVNDRASNNFLLYHKNLLFILNKWLTWGTDNSKVKEWCNRVIEKDDNMFLFIEKFILRTSISSGDSPSRIYSHININDMDPYIDVATIENRVLSLKEEGKIPSKYVEASILFLQGVNSWRKGKSPEDIL